jgi:hypothetical protein
VQILNGYYYLLAGTEELQWTVTGIVRLTDDFQLASRIPRGTSLQPYRIVSGLNIIGMCRGKVKRRESRWDFRLVDIISKKKKKINKKINEK